jgi:hypothetical protein
LASSEKLNSSTSSSKFNALEDGGRPSVPYALLVALAFVCLIEAGLWQNRVWFSDLAAWYWQTKYESIDDGNLRGNIAVIGTSVMFHGFDPSASESFGSRQVNLALNGMRFPHQAQMLRRYLSRGAPPQWLLIEVRDLEVDQSSFVTGPFWRITATLDEVIESGLGYFEPYRLLEFGLHRTLASYAYRDALDNWLFSSLKARIPERQYLERNIAAADSMYTHAGYSTGGFVARLDAALVPKPESRPWLVTDAGDKWLRRMLSIATQHSIRIALIQPPVPSFVSADRVASGFARDFNQYAESLRIDFPNLGLPILEFGIYPLSHFSDDHHLSPDGVKRFSAEMKEEIRKLQ